MLEVIEPVAPDFMHRNGVGRVLAAGADWERVFHGNPSGIDAAAAASAGCISFTRGEGITPVLLGQDLALAIAVAGPPASTKEMVEGLARLRDRRPDVVNKSIEGIHSLVKNARLCLEAGDIVGLGKLMDLNQMLHSGLFLSTEGIERACHIARSAGALGAKLNGIRAAVAAWSRSPRESDAVLQAWRTPAPVFLGAVCTALGVAAS